MHVRPAGAADRDAIWAILEPMIRAGETYTLPRDMSRDDALAMWFGHGGHVFVAEVDGNVAGTYRMSTNREGGGAHVANCGYVTSVDAGGRGVGRAMCEHSIARARELGYRAIQFNFVVASNARAVKLWQACGFQIVGTLPGAFLHPALGYVDAYVMYRTL